MRSLFPVFICLGVLSSRLSVHAQDAANYPPPKPPLVAAVPENAEWTITVEYPKEAKLAPDAPKHHDWRPVEVRTTKVGKTKRDLITTRDGVKQENWYVDAMIFWTNGQGEVSVTDLRAAEGSDPMEDSPSVPTGFPGVGWLKLDNYVDVVMFEKRPCYHYVRDEAEAWIDAETKLPVAYRRGKILYRFSFNPSPVGPLVMPPAYQTALETVRKMYGIRK